ncbi:MAG TPA: hypothetical protein VLJ58_10475 [Ramlibacter sp.]|nr:hypothetical protein [Ramlibacter sp.]
MQTYEGRLLCSARPGRQADVGATVGGVVGAGGGPREIMMALLGRFPCPFSPDRPELRPARSQEVTGAWVMPAASDRLRFGPRVARPVGPACESVLFTATFQAEGISFGPGDLLAWSRRMAEGRAQLEFRHLRRLP